MELRETFDDADADGEDTLDPEEFKKAFGHINKNMSDRELEQLFMKIDADANG